MKIKTMSIIFFVVAVLTACSSTQPEVEDPLAGTSWDLVFYRKSTVIEGSDVTAEFVDGEVAGSAGCNRYSGSYEVDGNKIKFGPVMSTLMACMDPEGIMDQETMILAWLQDAQTYQIQEDQLMIFRSDGEALTFIPASQ